MEWNQFKLRVSDDNFSKNIHWYDILKCNLYDSTEQVSFIYLPAAFLKQKGLLSNIDLGCEKQYCLDFNKFIKYGKNIDMLFNNYLKDNKYPIYKEMFVYCRHLYRKQGFLKNDFNKPIDQAEEQFVKEFKSFVSKLKCEEFINKKQYKVKYLHYIRDLLKIFILFKSSKIVNIEYPLDIFRDYLPDDAKIIELENMLSLTKDTGSVAPLYQRVGSRNEIYISKLYALMLTNLNISSEELILLFKYIIHLEEVTNNLLHHDLEKSLTLIKHNLIIDTKQNLSNNIFTQVVANLITIIGKKGNDLVNYFISNKFKISLCGYFILKIYIENRLKILNWNKIATEKSKLLQININKLSLLKIYDVTKKIPVNNCEDMLSVLNNADKLLSSKEQRAILDVIFPNDKRRKDKKRMLLKNNFRKISIVYLYYILKRGVSGQSVSFNHFYNLIVAAFLYFQLNSLEINEIKFINCGKNKIIDDRRKTLDSLYYQLSKALFSKQELNIKNIDYAYLEISNKIFSKYYFLFDLKITSNEGMFDRFTDIINELLYKFWQEGLEVAWKIVRI